MEKSLAREECPGLDGFMGSVSLTSGLTFELQIPGHWLPKTVRTVLLSSNWRVASHEGESEEKGVNLKGCHGRNEKLREFLEGIARSKVGRREA